MSKYLYITFKNAKVYSNTHLKKVKDKIVNANDTGKYKRLYIGEDNKIHADLDSLHTDEENIIPLHCVDAMLHCLCGFVPVKHSLNDVDERFVKHIKYVSDAAKTARIIFDKNVIVSEDGIKHIKETASITKSHVGASNVQSNEYPFNNSIVGEEIDWVGEGLYDFSILKYRCINQTGNTAIYDDIMEFIYDVVGTRNIGHTDAYSIIYTKRNDAAFINKANKFIEEHDRVEKNIGTNFTYLIFGRGNQAKSSYIATSDTKTSAFRNYVNQKGISSYTTISGKICVEISDEFENMLDTERVVTFLDSGVAYCGIQTKNGATHITKENMLDMFKFNNRVCYFDEKKNLVTNYN